MERDELSEALAAVGDLLEAEGVHEAVVVVGGASLSLLGLVPRATRDVDVIARVVQHEGAGEEPLIHPEPMPPALTRAVETVARDFGLPADWMNTDVALQWKTGLPPGLADELTWRDYGGLRVGLVGRRALIALKLFAAVDDGPRGVHFQDLVTLAVSDEELEQAAAWVRGQDAADEFGQMVDQVIVHARERRG